MTLDIEAMHDEVMIKVRNKQEVMNQLEQQMKHGTGLLGNNMSEQLPDWMKESFTQAASRFHRRPYESKTVAAYRRAIEKLTAEEVRWADAFRDEMKAKPDFYAKATQERRRWLEKHYTALSKQDTKAGQRAARVVVHRTMHALEGEQPQFPKLAEFKHHGSLTGRMHGHQIDAYRYLFGQTMPKEPKP